MRRLAPRALCGNHRHSSCPRKRASRPGGTALIPRLDSRFRGDDKPAGERHFASHSRQVAPALLLALSFATPALADPLDCAAIKSTTPVEIAYDWTWTRPGKTPLTVPMHEQIDRKADQTIVYQIFSPEKFVRRTLNGAGFMVEMRNAGDPGPRAVAYSIDVSKDYFGLGQPFAFDEIVKAADGAVVADMNTSVSFEGPVDMDLGGCTFALTKLDEVSHGTVRGKDADDKSEIWYSRELKTGLYKRIEQIDGSIIEVRARDISTSFKPVE